MPPNFVVAKPEFAESVPSFDAGCGRSGYSFLERAQRPNDESGEWTMVPGRHNQQCTQQWSRG
jgi:hypothetical protein